MRGTGVQEEQERNEPLRNGRVSSSVVFLVQLHPFTRSAGSVSSSPCHGWTAAITSFQTFVQRAFLRDIVKWTAGGIFGDKRCQKMGVQASVVGVYRVD